MKIMTSESNGLSDQNLLNIKTNLRFKDKQNVLEGTKENLIKIQSRNI